MDTARMNLTQQPIGTQNLPANLAGSNTAATQSKSLKQTAAASTKGSGSQSGRGLTSKKPKQKSCKVCKTPFTPSKPMQTVCGLQCALSLASAAKAKRERTQASQERKETKAKLEKMKPRGEWIAEAQTAFNRYIRLRDAGKPCICCGLPMGPSVPGGSVDAGHYRSRGSAPHLRFDERNVHAQRKQCNRYGSGNVVGYRVGLIAKIGLKAVEELESDQTPRNHTIDDLKAIKSKYTAMARELERLNG